MTEETYNVVTGIVINNDDPYGGNRIQVRLGNVYDGTKNNNELLYCTPLLPKLLHVIPKPGELVLVFLQKSESSDGNRFYVGPVLSQAQKFYHELSHSAQAFMDNPDGTDNMTLENPKHGDNIGSVPDLNDVAIIGRDNCDIVMKEHDMRMRCGYKNSALSSSENNLEFNHVSPAFIQMQWKKREDEKCKLNDKSYDSSINIYADRINLLSRFSDVNIGEIDNNDLITDEKMTELLNKCHPLVYGDILINYLKQLQHALLTHTHPYSMLPPVQDASMNKLTSTIFDNMLSKAVKTC